MSFLLDYRSAIHSGEIKAGMYMVQELDRLIEDLDSPEYIYDTHDADIRIDFIEHCIKLTKSPYYGKPMELLLWEKAFIEVFHSFKIRSVDSGAWVDRFQESLLLIARKNGKSELIAAMQLTELILGREGSDIVCSGMDDGTADLAYQAIDTMRLMIDPKQVDTWRNQKGIKCLVNGSHIYKLSASTRQREGRNIDYAGIDEVWSLPADELKAHPYIRDFQTAKAIVLYRDNTPRGEWTVEGLAKAGIIKEETAAKLARCRIETPAEP
jgi:phage terminase large subunit-like protein